MIQDNGLRIPQEVYNFFTNPGGHSLVLRGNAGAGKTTLALQIIEDLSAIERSYYFPTRVSDQALFAQFPWLKEKMEKLRLPPARLSKQRSNSNGQVVDLHRDGLGTLKGIGPTKALNSKTTMQVSIGKDMEEIENLYEVIEDRLPERTLLVIDSLDALAERNGLTCIKLLSSIQKDIVEGYGSNVLYVLESPEPMLDYLGDGVIKVSLSEHQGRRLREIEILKLRGTEIQQPKYLCTLKGGKMRSFGYWWERNLAKKSWMPIPDGEGRVSTGILDMDHLLQGGIERSAVVMVELGTGVPLSVASTFEASLVSNFISHGRGVIWIPVRKASAESVRNRVSSHVPKEQFDRLVKVPELASSLGPGYVPCVLPVEGSNAGSDLKWQNISYALQGAAQPYLSLIGFDTLESMYGVGVMESLVDHLTAIRRNGGVFVGMVTPSSASASRLADLATVTLRIERIGGTVVLYGEEPFTECNAMALMEQERGGNIGLTPIV
jgi:KaiC/GvpD/RAD55 family RecA-like ATPase